MEKQVDKTHYEFSKYMDKMRWISVWHQLDEVIKLMPASVLEIGPGGGLLKVVASLYGIKIITLDIDQELNPDYVASVTELPFNGKEFDVICAFEVLEHMPYKDAIDALIEIKRVARKNILLSLPDVGRQLRFAIRLPFFGNLRVAIPLPILNIKAHEFDGEHFWELNKRGYSLKKFYSDTYDENWMITDTYRVDEYPYHRFIVLKYSGCD